MTLFLIGALAIATLAIVFALQNAVPIAVSFLFWRFRGSLAMVLLLTFVLGVVMGLLASMPAVIKRTWAIANQKKRIEELEEEL